MVIVLVLYGRHSACFAALLLEQTNTQHAVRKVLLPLKQSSPITFSGYV